MSAEGTKDSCRPFRASLCVEPYHRGLTPPSVFLSPLRGFPCLGSHRRGLTPPSVFLSSLRGYFVKTKSVKSDESVERHAYAKEALRPGRASWKNVLKNCFYCFYCLLFLLFFPVPTGRLSCLYRYILPFRAFRGVVGPAGRSRGWCRRSR